MIHPRMDVDYSDLVAWPAKLEHLTIAPNSFEPPEINHNFFRSALLHQQHSLKHLVLRGCTSEHPIFVCDFPNLETIAFSISLMNTHWHPQSVVSSILSAPRLKKLLWNIYKYQWLGEDETECCDLDSGGIHWLTRVVQLAHAHRCALEEVEILYAPRSLRCCLGRTLPEKLDLLDELEHVLEGLGMRLVFTKFRAVKNLERNPDIYGKDLYYTLDAPWGYRP